MSRKLSILALAILVIPATTVLAQPADCTGMSDVSNFNGSAGSDFVGLLTGLTVTSGLTEPVHAAFAPGDNDRMFIVEKRGVIRIYNLGTGVLQPAAAPFLNIDPLVLGSGEQGLLGLAFHPDYNTPGADNEGNFFVYYTNSSGSAQIIARYSRTFGNPDDANEGSGQVALSISHPTFSNHNGGGLAFRPSDGHLYIGTGDGGGGCDPGPGAAGNAQSTSSLLGKILRINVDELPYSTAGNPYDGGAPGLDEIWSIGSRNPVRITFDRETSAIYIADVGQDIAGFEEVNCSTSATGGENYGWSYWEGTTCGTCGASTTLCNSITRVDPVGGYNWFGGASIMGGVSYQGCRMKDLAGTYFYTDHGNSTARSFRSDGQCGSGPEIDRTADLEDGINISGPAAIIEDNRGEMYIINRTGFIHRIEPDLSIMEASGPGAIPVTLGNPGGDFEWEDMTETSLHPIVGYKVYRSSDGPVGDFTCQVALGGTTWTGGDPDVPASGQAFFYLVTGLTQTLAETSPGFQSNGTARVVDTLSGC